MSLIELAWKFLKFNANTYGANFSSRIKRLETVCRSTRKRLHLGHCRFIFVRKLSIKTMKTLIRHN